MFARISCRSLITFLFLAGSVLALPQKTVGQDSPETTSETVSYHTQIKPIFQAHCQGCHQPANPKGGYVMTSFSLLLKGGESGETSIVPGQHASSELIRQITPLDGTALMPKGKTPLNPAQRELIQNWIAQGAVDDTPASAKVVYDAANPPVYRLAPAISSLDFSPDGSLLAVSGHHEALLHKADGSGLVTRFVGVSDRIESVRFSPDGTKLLVTGGAPGRMGEIQVWEVATRKLLLSLTVTHDTLYGGSWSPDGTKIAFGCADNTLRVIEAETGKEVLFQGSHEDWVLDTVFSVDGSHLVSVSRDQTAKLTEFETERFVDNITSITPGALKGGLASVSRHPARDEILVGGADGIPRTYRMHRETSRVIGDDANLVRQFPAIRGRIFSTVFSPDGQKIAAGSSLDGTGVIGIYSYPVDGSLPEEVKKAQAKVVSARTPEEKQLITEYNTKDVQKIAEAVFQGSGLFALAYHPDGTKIAIGGADGQIRLIDSNNAEVITQFSSVPVRNQTEQTAQKKQSWQFGSNEEPRPEKISDKLKIQSLQLTPEKISLSDPSQYAQLIVMATLESGDVVDVTRQVAYRYDPAFMKVDRFGLLHPLSDGQQKLQVELSGLSASADVEMNCQQEAIPADYVQRVTPILSKLGCNQGTCHGSAQGKAGFKMSLRGYDPLFDIRSLTDDHASRRTNVAAPEESLMLLKAIGGVPHVGGQLTTVDHKYYHVLKSWIEQGAKLDRQSARVVAIELYPQNPVIQTIDSRQQVRVIATYSDGSTRDVTYESFVESGNTEVAIINSSGLLTSVRRGEAPILARYEGAYAATTLTVMGDRTGFEWNEPEKFNQIDELVADKWRRMKILPSELCTDAEFIRRVTFDLTGLPPTAEVVQEFLADNRPTQEKRNDYVNRLIGSEDYVEHFANKWADMLLVNGKFLGGEGAGLFRDWIRKQVADNKPYDQFVKEILTATGSNKTNPPASYYKVLRTPEETMENTTHLFLGVRFNCNRCHDHPFERWTQDQYYETAAYFSQLEFKRAPESGDRNIGGSAVESGKPLYEMVLDKTDGEIVHERTGEVALPKFPYQNESQLSAEKTRREQLSEWMTAPENSYFARSYVNRIWGYLLGAGIIEPIDDIRAGNPPTNPELLDYLTQEFVEHEFDVQHIVRLICQSRTYQLSIVSNSWNEDDQINFSHARARRLSAEALFDAIHLVTGSKSKIPGAAVGIRAAALADSETKLPDGFLNNFGRPTRENSCECERSNEVQLGPVMALVCGPTISNAIADPENSLGKLAQDHQNNTELVKALFLRILNRHATEKEITASLKAFDGLDQAHDELAGLLVKKEQWWKETLPVKERQRLEAIAQAEKRLANYKAEIEPRVAEAERQRQEKIDRAEQDLSGYETGLRGEPLSKWLTEQRANPTGWYYLQAKDLKGPAKAKLKQLDDSSILAKQSNEQGSYELAIETNQKEIRSLRIEALTHDSLPRKGPGLAGDGNFVLTEFLVHVASPDAPDNFTQVKLVNAKTDFSQGNYDVATAIDGEIKPNSNGWAISPQTGKDHWATFQLAEPLQFAGTGRLKLVMEQHYQSKQHWLGRFRISASSEENADPKSSGQPERLHELLQIAEADLDEKQREELFAFFKTSDAEFAKKMSAVQEAKKPLPIDPRVTALEAELVLVQEPVRDDTALLQLRQDVEMSEALRKNDRLTATQDIAWALINSPSFLFNR